MKHDSWTSEWVMPPNAHLVSMDQQVPKKKIRQTAINQP